MKLLQVGVVIPYVSIEMKELGGEGVPTEVLAPLAKLSPHILIDLNDQILNSMSIGSLAQIVSLYREEWGEKFVPVNLVGVNAGVSKVLSLANLVSFFQVWADTATFFNARQQKKPSS